MSTSGGGGYCDCGDPEAWKTDVFCDTHKPQTHESPDAKVCPHRSHCPCILLMYLSTQISHMSMVLGLS